MLIYPMTGKSTKCFMRKMFACLLFAICSSCPAWAQLSTGSIVGTVVDPSGAVVPSASISAVQMETRVSRQTTTNDHGAFVFNSMEPGSYTLTFTAAGFKTQQTEHLILTTSSTLSVLPVKMEVGAVAQTVTTYAQGAQVETESSERAELISANQVQNLPVRGRNFTDLVSLLPGVLNTNVSQDISSSPAIYVNGSRDTTNAFYIDGIPSADNGNGAGMKNMISQDALSEVKVETANYQAEYGRESGSTVVAVTKSGTRDFHGLVSYFNRNEDYNANNYFSNLNGLARSKYRYNTIAYNIGGPITIPHVFNRSRTKLFFFWNQELWPTTNSSTGSLTVPNALERKGNFSQSFQPSGVPYAVTNPFNNNAPFPGGVIPANELDANGLALLNLFPLPNFTNTAISKGNYNYVFSVPIQTPLSTETFKIDYQLNQADSISGSFNTFNNTQTGSVGATANTFTFPEAIDTYYTRTKAITLQWQHIFSATLLNNIHIGYLQQPAAQTYTSDQLPLLQRSSNGFNLGQFYLSANPLDLLPNASFGGVPDPVSINIDNRFPLYNRYYDYTLGDDVSYTRGSHNMKAGVYEEEFKRHQMTGETGFNGNFSFANNKSNPLNAGYAFANAALGTFYSYQEASAQGQEDVFSTDFEAYLQDTWKVTRKLTLDYGLRIYHIPPLVEQHNQISGFSASQYNPAQAVALIKPALAAGKRVGIDAGTGKQYPAADIGAVSPSIGNPADGMVVASSNGPLGRSLTPSAGVPLGPRLGFAYDVFGNGKMAIRGGVGIFPDRPTETPSFDNFVGQSPLIQQPTVYNGQLSTFLTSTGLLFPATVYGGAKAGHLATGMNYSLSVQQEMGFNTILDISYVGSQDRHLIWEVDQNAEPLGADFLPGNQDPTNPGSPLPSSFYRPIAGYNSIYQLSNGANSNYNSLQISAQRRFAHSLNFFLAYTWSKTMDFADTDAATVAYVVPVRAYNYSLASFDVPQILQLNVLYDLPKAPFRNLVARNVLGNWQLSSISSFESGQPNGVTIGTTTGEDITGTTSVTPRAVLTGDPNLVRNQRTFAHYFNTSTIQLPAVGTFGNAPRLFIRGPGVNNTSLSIMKNIPIHERVNFQIRVDAYNAFNHTQFSTINTTTDFTPAGVQTNTAFGQITAARDPRQLQMSGRITF